MNNFIEHRKRANWNAIFDLASVIQVLLTSTKQRWCEWLQHFNNKNLLTAVSCTLNSS
jgi:hypothetical protein